MREIKFRAWTGKEMAHIDLGEQYADTTEFYHCEVEDWPIMQFTGLKDKNGKEIYEGDIYRTDGLQGVCAVEWDESMSMWGFSRHDDESIYGRDNIEVIGNIYENPLLNK